MVTRADIIRAEATAAYELREQTKATLVIQEMYLASLEQLALAATETEESEGGE